MTADSHLGAEKNRRVLVKVCGVTTVADALAACSAGADWIGLNFHPASPRFVSVERAASITRALPTGVVPVGVFVNRPALEVAEIARAVGLLGVQLHGDEPPGDLLALGRGFRTIRAFRLADAASIAAMTEFLRQAAALGAAPFAVLVDSFVAGERGGTGRTIDEELLTLLPRGQRLVLAGGLTPENVRERIQKTRPWMVDVASGVESAPGEKDRAKLVAFVDEAKRDFGCDLHA
jgi:phosphoribosylanthranilate isomerase